MKEFTQLCVLHGVVLGEASPIEFEKFMEKNFSCRFKFAAEVKTNPDLDEHGNPVPDTGGRTDILFYVHSEDVSRFAVPRLSAGIRWWEDVLGNGGAYLYSSEVLDKYQPTWNEDAIRAANKGYKLKVT